MQIDYSIAAADDIIVSTINSQTGLFVCSRNLFKLLLFSNSPDHDLWFAFIRWLFVFSVVIVVMVVLLIGEYVFVFIPLASSLNDESKHSKLMFLLVPFETVLRLPDIVAMLGQNACLLFFLCCMLLLFLISLCLITFPVLCALDWVAASCIVVGLDSGDEEGGGAAKTNLQNLQSSSSSSASEDEGGTEGASSMFLLSSLSITIVLLIDCTHSFFGFVRDAFRFWLVMFRLLSDSLALDLFVLSSVSCVCLFSSGGYAHPFLHWFAGYSFVSLHSPLVHVLLFLSVSLCFSVFFSSCSFNCVDCSSCCGFSDTVGS